MTQTLPSPVRNAARWQMPDRGDGSHILSVIVIFLVQYSIV